jgi:hypothetical protein
MNTLAKMSSIKETSILRDLKSPKVKNKNFCPLLFTANPKAEDSITRILKKKAILVE